VAQSLGSTEEDGNAGFFFFFSASQLDASKDRQTGDRQQRGDAYVGGQEDDSTHT